MDSGTVALVAAGAVVIAAAIGAAATITAALITSRNKEPKRGGQEKGLEQAVDEQARRLDPPRLALPWRIVVNSGWVFGGVSLFLALVMPPVREKGLLLALGASAVWCAYYLQRWLAPK